MLRKSILHILGIYRDNAIVSVISTILGVTFIATITVDSMRSSVDMILYDPNNFDWIMLVFAAIAFSPLLLLPIHEKLCARSRIKAIKRGVKRIFEEQERSFSFISIADKWSLTAPTEPIFQSDQNMTRLTLAAEDGKLEHITEDIRGIRHNGSSGQQVEKWLLNNRDVPIPQSWYRK